MTEIKVEAVNLEEVQALFDERKVKRSVGEALENYLFHVRMEARRRVHVDTGLLKGSLTHRVSGLTGLIRGVYYGIFEEFRPGRKHGTPHSFLRPSFEAKERKFREELEEKLCKP